MNINGNDRYTTGMYVLAHMVVQSMYTLCVTFAFNIRLSCP